MKQQFQGTEGSHDWQHVERVWRTACHLQEIEGGDRIVVQLAALLHDISDHKLNGGELNAGGRVAKELLLQLGGSDQVAEQVAAIVDGVSFKGARVADEVSTLEGQIVQDADRLDAMGAIGIARAFAFGGARHRSLYDPAVAPQLHQTFESYAKAQGDTINHFHEKLLLLKDRLHTPTAQRIGEHRHAVMVKFLEDFHSEWDLRF